MKQPGQSSCERQSCSVQELIAEIFIGERQITINICSTEQGG